MKLIKHRQWTVRELFRVVIISQAICYLTLVTLGTLGYLENRQRADENQQRAAENRALALANLHLVHEQKITTDLLHRDSCRLANANRKVIRDNVKANYADALAFLRTHPRGIPGLFTRSLVLRNLDRIQANYEVVWPVDCTYFVSHPRQPPRLIRLPPLSKGLP